MTSFPKPLKASFAIAGVLFLCSLFPCVSAADEAPKATRTRKRSRANVVKQTPVARAIDAEEMLSLLKRDGTRPLLVNYWATWCDPCREEFPDLVKIDRQFRSQGLDFIAITLDDLAELKTGVPKFLRQMKARMPVYLLNVSDPEPAINSVDRNWTGALPATFLYNSKGEIVFKQFGRVNTDQLRAEIEKLVGSRQEQ